MLGDDFFCPLCRSVLYSIAYLIVRRCHLFHDGMACVCVWIVYDVLKIDKKTCLPSKVSSVEAYMSVLFGGSIWCVFIHWLRWCF